jgi:probable F420-dependent oxidoreductase
MKFGVGLATGMEGLMYPVPFGNPGTLVRISQTAEHLGYHHVGGNDHLTTQHYVAVEWPDPPNYYDIFVALSFVAAATDRLLLQTAVAVIPVREPVVLAKQAATLDLMSGGRLILGVGIGAYREEFEAVHPATKEWHRGKMIDEGMQALRVLFRERQATFEGEYFRFHEVEMYPKPLQNPLPLWVGGNSDNGLARAARYGDGWLPAVLSPDEIQQRVERIHVMAEAAGRDPRLIAIAPQLAVSIASTPDKALQKFTNSQVFKHLLSLSKSTLKHQPMGDHRTRNLIGTPEEIIEQVARYQQAGCDTLSALIFAGNSEQEVIDDMAYFATTVMPHFCNAEC